MESTSLAEALGLPERFAPDWMAPPVDRNLLERFLAGKLTDLEKEQANDYVASFRTWRAELRDVLREDAERRPVTPPDPEG